MRTGADTDRYAVLPIAGDLPAEALQQQIGRVESRLRSLRNGHAEACSELNETTSALG